MHLHILPHNILIGLAPVGFLVVNSIRSKPFYFIYEQVYICRCQSFLVIYRLELI